MDARDHGQSAELRVAEVQSKKVAQFECPSSTCVIWSSQFDRMGSELKRRKYFDRKRFF